jgi:hypothetical protein
MTQLFIALFGLTSIWLAMGRNPTGRKWAPIVGLCGQPAWAWFAYQTEAWGIAALVALYTAVYVRGALVQWRGA